MDATSIKVYESVRAALDPAMRLFFRVRTEGAENVPDKGAALVICNHRSYLDPLVLMHSIHRPINFGAGSHLYAVPGTAPLMNLVGFFPVNIYGGAEGDKSIDEASRLLSEGELVGLFPEGIESFMYINRVSKISTFKTGFALMALENRVPVIPCALAPLEEKGLVRIPGFLVKPFVNHPAAKDGVDLVTYRHITCRIGRPLDLSGYFEEQLTKDLIDHVSAKIRRIVIKLYDGEDLDRFLTGEKPFDFSKNQV